MGKFKNSDKMIIMFMMVFCLVCTAGSDVFGLLSATAESFKVGVSYEKKVAADELYNREERGAVSILYFDGDEKYVDLILNSIMTYLDLLSIDFDVPLGDTMREKKNGIVCVIYPDKQELEKFINANYDIPPMGAYSNGRVYILSPEQWIFSNSESEVKTRFIHEGPIAHELTHLAVDVATNGNYPVWFTEGVALYYESKYMGIEWREDVSDKCKDISYADLSDRFRELDETLAYRRSYEIIDNYVSTYGEEMLCANMKRLKLGLKFEDVFNFNP